MNTISLVLYIGFLLFAGVLTLFNLVYVKEIKKVHTKFGMVFPNSMQHLATVNFAISFIVLLFIMAYLLLIGIPFR